MSTSNCRIAGLLAVLAAILLSLADISFLYSPKGGYESEEMLFLLDIPLWRLKLGHFLGVFALPFYLFGYWIVYRALKPAGRWFSLPIFWIITYGVIVGAVLHGSIAMYAILMQEHEAAASVEAGRVLSQLMEISLDLFEPFQATAFLCFGLTAIWYFVAVFFKQTLLHAMDGFFKYDSFTRTHCRSIFSNSFAWQYSHAGSDEHCARCIFCSDYNSHLE